MNSLPTVFIWDLSGANMSDDGYREDPGVNLIVSPVYLLINDLARYHRLLHHIREESYSRSGTALSQVSMEPRRHRLFQPLPMKEYPEYARGSLFNIHELRFSSSLSCLKKFSPTGDRHDESGGRKSLKVFISHNIYHTFLRELFGFSLKDMPALRGRT